MWQHSKSEKEIKLNIAKTWITPERAQQYLDGHENYRPLNMKRAMKYAEVMEMGAWEVGPPIVFDEIGKLIDGQTRLKAVILHGQPVEFAVIRGMNGNAVKVFDNGANRRGADVLRHCGGFEGKNVRRYQTMIRAIHIGCPLTTKNRKTILNCEYPTLYAEYQDAVDFTATTFNQKMRVAGVIAPFYGVFGRAYICHPEEVDLLSRIAQALHNLRFDDRLNPIRLYQKWAMSNNTVGWEAYCETYLKAARAIQATINNEPITRLYRSESDPFEI